MVLDDGLRFKYKRDFALLVADTLAGNGTHLRRRGNRCWSSRNT
jgi:hypothetical protein